MKSIYENNLNTLEQYHKTLWEAFSRDSSLEENEFAFVTQAKMENALLAVIRMAKIII